MDNVTCPTCYQAVPDADTRTELILRLRHHTAYQGFSMKDVRELADDILAHLSHSDD